MLRKEDFEEYGKNQLKEIIQKGERPIIIAGFIDYFGDAVIVSCSECGVPVFVRPWLYVTILECNLKVVCLCCVDPQVFKCQLVIDLAKMLEGLLP